jgi:RES domain-containing protein
MEVYRVTLTKYACTLSGEGARLFGGRWNRRGTPCIYASENRSLAVLEYSANITLDIIPRALSIVCIEIPSQHIRRLTVAQLPGNWRSTAVPMTTKHFGNKLLRESGVPAFAVPSVIIPDELNYVLNPLHTESIGFRIKDIRDFPYDIRVKQ